MDGEPEFSRVADSSNPFRSPTREYVQIVIRNSDVYRLIYGPSPSSDREQARLSKSVSMKTVATRRTAAMASRSAAAGETR